MQSISLNSSAGCGTHPWNVLYNLIKLKARKWPRLFSAHLANLIFLNSLNYSSWENKYQWDQTCALVVILYFYIMKNPTFCVLYQMNWLGLGYFNRAILEVDYFMVRLAWKNLFELLECPIPQREFSAT